MYREIDYTLRDIANQILRLCEASRFESAAVWTFQDRVRSALDFTSSRSIYRSLVKIKQILNQSNLPAGYGFRFQVEGELRRLDRYTSELNRLNG